MKTTGTKKELESALSDFYLKQGIVLQNIKIFSSGKWSAEKTQKKKTINQLLNEIYILLPQQRTMVSRLKRSIKWSFTSLASNKTHAKLASEKYDEECKRADEYMQDKDADFLRTIKEEDFLHVCNTGKKQWEFLQMIITNYL